MANREEEGVSSAVRNELAQWIRTLAATVLTAGIVFVAVTTSSWLVAGFGAALIVALFVAAHVVEGQSDGAP